MKNALRCLFSIIYTLLILTPAIAQEVEKDAVYQISTLSALEEGCYDGTSSLKALRKFGDFGIGTYEALDGEMVLLDGNFYQIKADGKVYQPVNITRTPFAMITYFEPDAQIMLEHPMNLKELQALIDSLLPSKNIFYAVKIEGDFHFIKTRSVPGQKKPYLRLIEIIKNQSTFETTDLKGTIVGYWLPEYMKGISSPGYHFHFLSADKKSGGHLLECHLNSGTLSIDYTYKYDLDVSSQNDFYKIDVSGDKQKELEKIEK